MTFNGERIFITGGAGFLARAFYRRARREGWNATFTAFSRGDATHARLQREYPEVKLIRGDVAGDPEFLAAAMAGHDYVIHMAATKYVDLGERAAENTVRINVDGSRNVIRAARAARVQRTVAISTDKACQPVNVYGMTKALMERLFQEAAAEGEFVAVRYGNVVGSTGSVCTLFEQQLQDAGRMRITDPHMTRFWMGVDEAIDLVLYALAIAPPGALVIPKPRAMTIVNLAHSVWSRHAEGPAPFDEIGVRPGEKRHELLMHAEESVRSNDGPHSLAQYYELAPPGTSARLDVPFMLTSSEPMGGWIGIDEMRGLIIDAEDV